MSGGTVIIEASKKSGTKAQARLTMEQGRLLFVLKPIEKDRTTAELPLILLNEEFTMYNEVHPISTGEDIIRILIDKKVMIKQT